MSSTPLKKAEAPVKPKPSRVHPKGPESDVEPEPAAMPQRAQDAAAAIATLRKRRAQRLARRAGVGIGLPSLFASIYFFALASPQFESVSLFMVQSAESRMAVGLETLIGAVPGAGATRDTLAVRDFILSREMLAVLEKEHAYRKHYQSASLDWISRLAADASFEETFEYYEDMLRVDHDSNSGVLTLKVRAFSAEYAQELSKAVLRASETMVNQLSERARLDQTKLARDEVTNAETRLTEARRAIVALQQQHVEFNPEATATEALSLRGALKAELAKARAELMEARAFMQPSAPKVIAIEERVKSLSAQVAQESQRLVNPRDEKGLNTSMAEFDAAIVEKEFAQGAYQSALTSLEVARTEAARQHRYLATIAQPSVPDEETHPKRLRAVITVVIFSAMLLGIGSLLVAAVREHARI